MKKKLALLLAGIMVVGMIPMTAFAATTNRITKIATGDDDTTLKLATAPVLKMFEKDLNDISTTQAFQLDLTNAEWNFDEISTKDAAGRVLSVDYSKIIQGLKASSIDVTQLSAKSIIVEGEVDPNTTLFDGDHGIQVVMLTDLTDEGDATVTVDPMHSVLTAGTYKFATVAGGSTTVTVEKKQNVSENGKALKNVVIKETSPNALKNGELKFKLSSDWSFDWTQTKVEVYPTKYKANIDNVLRAPGNTDHDPEQYVLDVRNLPSNREEEITISLTAFVNYDDDEVEPGDVCTMTVSGAGVDRVTLDVATAITYGVKWEAEDKTLPVFYSGRADADQDSLKVHLEEAVESSWLANRKTKIVFPDGVRVLGVETSGYKNMKEQNMTFALNDDANEITVKFNSAEDVESTKKTEIDFQFQLSIAPSFTGDITATLTGNGVDDTIEAVVGVAVAPVTVEAVKTDALIDYRKTDVGDITITEAEPGLLEKGKKLILRADKLKFDDDPTVEVVSGDLKLEKVTTDEGDLIITIDSESAKEAAVIKVSNVNLFMERDIPAGDYALKLVAKDDTLTKAALGANWNNNTKDQDFGGFDGGKKSKNAIFQNSVTSGSDYDQSPLFDSRTITVYPDYVRVVTAGRDVDDSTFTTKLTVTIGATSMTAGDKTIALDVPAYIANGYTMLPVRAVTEALSGSAIVRWDDPTHTVTITFGSRVVNMVVGSNVMVINGVDVPMQAKCEITNSRAFIPLRDMGYALGLNDSKIAWDDATKTATLN